MIFSQYQLKAIIGPATTSVVALGNLTLHTVVCPIATLGATTFRDSSAVTYFVLPIGSIGTYRLDASLAKGLTVVTADADTVLISYKTP